MYQFRLVVRFPGQSCTLNETLCDARSNCGEWNPTQNKHHYTSPHKQVMAKLGYSRAWLSCAVSGRTSHASWPSGRGGRGECSKRTMAREHSTVHHSAQEDGGFVNRSVAIYRKVKKEEERNKERWREKNLRIPSFAAKVTRTVHSCIRPISKRKRRRRKTARIQRLRVSPLIRLDNERLCNLLDNLLRRRLSRPLRVARLDLRLRPLDLLHQKVNPLVRAHAVRQMGRKHRQSAQADSITRLADDLDLLGGEVLDLVAVLQLLCVAVEDNTSDLVLDARVELLDRAVVHGGAL
jgi:hypothetical protein